MQTYSILDVPTGGDIAAIRAAALRAVDTAAELKRQAWLTPGSGQALEYEATRAEAAAYQPGQPAGTYPMLEAEVAALTAAGIAIDLDTVADHERDQIFLLDAAMAAIKAARRTAKIRIEAAGVEAMEAILTEYRLALAAIEIPT